MIAALYNVHTRTSETDPVQDWTDFFTEWKKEPREQTEEEMIEVMRAFATSTQGMTS